MPSDPKFNLRLPSWLAGLAGRSQVQPIGLDIGHDSVKLLQVQVKGEGASRALSVVAAGYAPVPAQAATVPARRTALCAETIQRLLAQQPFVGREVVATLPRELVHVKNLRLPPIPPDELQSAIQFEARSIFPFDTETARIEFLPAGEVRHGSETWQEVIVLAVKQADIDDYLEQLDLCGVVVKSLETEITGLFRAFERFARRRDDEQEVQMLIDVGARRTQVIIGKGKQISFYKTVEIGGMHLLDAVGRKVGITLEEARALRQRLIDVDEQNESSPEALQGGGGRELSGREAVRHAVTDATRSIAEELAHELAMCLRYYTVTFRGHRGVRARVVGGEANDTRLLQTLKNVLNIPVEPARPLLNVDSTTMRAADRKGTMAQWTLALGLGLRFVPGYFAGRDGRARTITAASVASTAPAPEKSAASTDSSLTPPVEPSAGPLEIASVGASEIAAVLEVARA